MQGRKQNAFKENQEKIARLQGMQSADGSDVADHTAVRKSEGCLVSSIFIAQRKPQSNPSVKPQQEK